MLSFQPVKQSLRNGGENVNSSTNCISQPLFVQEIGQGDKESAEKRLNAVENIPLVAPSPGAQRLAEDLVAKGAVPQNSEEDALHIGIAAAAGIVFLLTWNFKHINNAHTKAAITAVVESRGFVCPILCSPEELGVEI
jgi:hypothetical protein